MMFPAEVKAAYAAACLDGSDAGYAGYYISEHPDSTPTPPRRTVTAGFTEARPNFLHILMDE